MPLLVTAAIVEPNMLIREGLTSLLERYSYRVVGSTDGAAGFVAQAPPEQPKLALVGAETTDQALVEAEKVRKLWPETKVVLLLLKSTSDVRTLHQILASEIDGCVPLSVSRETLMRTVDLVMLADAKIMVMVGTLRSGTQPFIDEAESPRLQDEHAQDERNGTSPVHATSPPLALVNSNDDVVDVVLNGPRQRNLPRLSERESQILNSIVHGCSNKIIARKYGITEATVKVHMKSILRKIQVANRTQAAVWAMENNYAIQLEKHLMDDDADGAAA